MTVGELAEYPKNTPQVEVRMRLAKRKRRESAQEGRKQEEAAAYIERERSKPQNLAFIPQ
jgi:hypothetical protein